MQTYLISEKQRLNFKPTYLMIKHHKLTGLKYFCKTTKNNPLSYDGSGKYWKSHIQKYGKEHIETLWILKFDDINLLNEFALFFSEEHNIINSNKWANLIPETGLDARGTMGFKFSEETKNKMSLRRKGVKPTDQAKQKRALARVGSKQPNASINKSLTWSITDPYGISYITTNLKSFCKTHNLKYNSVIGVSIRGIIAKRGSISGWKFSKI
jgi:hypothetical protein